MTKDITLPKLLTLLAALLIVALPSCSDDTPTPVDDDIVFGIWSDQDGHYLDIDNIDHIQEYQLTPFQGTDYWVRRTTVYLLEPVSMLMLMEDFDGTLNVYKVISADEQKMVLCWVATPDLSSLEGDNKLEIFQVFFKQDYKIDPKNYRTYRKISPTEFKKILGDTEIIDG